ncbi:MAG: YdcF family protein [Oscillospiraceae bacterium]|nr:YdcF family protein [Oscillospiraceae bacterium]
MGYKSYRGNSPQRKKRHLLTALLILLGLGLVLFGTLEIVIATHSRDRLMEDPQPEVMVIFGCQMRKDGPSILLKDRLDTALTYWEEHPDIKIVVTGGKGDDEHVSEAQGMYDYLTAHGVDGESIYMEDKSRNTWQNINNTFALMEREGWSLTDDVLLVSSGFHLARIEMLWDRVRTGTLRDEVYNDQHISTLAAPVSHKPSAVQMFFREPLALVKSFLFDR